MGTSRRRPASRPRHLTTGAARLTLAGAAIVLLLAAGAAVAGAQSQAASEPAAVGLTADGTPSALGIDDATPVLRWRIASSLRAVAQTKYRVLVASSADKLTPADADVWDTGDVQSAAMAVKYAGPALEPRTRYYWTVRVSTKAGVPAVGGRVSDWSSPTWFETAYLSPA